MTLVLKSPFPSKFPLRKRHETLMNVVPLYQVCRRLVHRAMFEGGRDCPPSGEKERLPRVDREAYSRPTKAVDRRRRLILSAIDVNAREIYCFTGLAHSSMPLASLLVPPSPLPSNSPACSFSLSTVSVRSRRCRHTSRRQTKE